MPKKQILAKTRNIITPRHFSFDFSKVPTYWLRSDPFAMHLFNASSHALPLLEGLVNFSVRQVMDLAIKNSELYMDSHHFIEQESLHARQHNKYNEMLKSHHFFLENDVNALKQKLINIKRRSSSLSLLAMALGFECITTFMSEKILQSKILDDADETVRNFWKWHLMEELEHKNVLMDLYLYIGGGYIRRIIMLTYVLLNYLYIGLRIYIKLLRKDKLSIIKGLFALCRKKSFFFKAIFKVFTCYRFSYHPNQIVSDGLVDFDK